VYPNQPFFAWMAMPFVGSKQWGTGQDWHVPLHIPLLFVALPTGYLFWRDRRYQSLSCQGCGYDLTGNVSGACPECGQTVAGPVGSTG
jgi:hypothetical protein